MEKVSRTQTIFDWPRCKRLRPLLHRPVHRQPPRGEEGEGGRGAAGRGRGGRRGEEGWGCGGRFSNNYIELRWWWVAMVTAVPSVSYD